MESPYPVTPDPHVKAANTSTDGRFTLQLPIGEFDLYAWTNVSGIDLPIGTAFPSGASRTSDNRQPAKVGSVMVKTGESIELGDIVVHRTKPISVRVIDSLGKPVENAQVNMRRVAIWEANQGQVSPQTLENCSDTVMTNIDGRCSVRPISNLRAGYVLMAAKNQNGNAYYGEMMVDSIPNGQVDIRLQPAALIKGTLTHNSEPLVGVELQLSEPGIHTVATFKGVGAQVIKHESSLFNRASTTTNHLGEFELIAPIGKRYQIEYLLPDLNKAAATVVFSGNVGTANLNLVSGNSKLASIVLDPNGSPAHEVRVRLKMGDEFKHSQGFCTSFYADSKGRFEISDLPSGSYRVVVTTNGTNSQEFELETDRAEQVIQLR